MSRLRRPVLALAAAASSLAAGCAASSAATPPGDPASSARAADRGPGRSAARDAAHPDGRDGDEFKVFVVPDMEGMAGTVFSREVLSGAEANCDDCFTSPDYERFRKVLADDVNAVIAGAREAGATAFTVNEGHGGNDFANIQPWDVDPEAVLVRGWPKPLVMITGLDETFDTVIFVGAHADAGSSGVMAHNFAMDAFTVNGVPLNEVGINALMAGSMGVSVSMVSGDDVLVEEARRILPEVETVTTKIAYGRNAAATWTPARTQERLREAARAAVEGERAGRHAPYRLDPPYRVELTLRKSFFDLADQVAALDRYRLERTGEGSFRFTTDDALEIGHFLNDLEIIVFQ